MLQSCTILSGEGDVGVDAKTVDGSAARAGRRRPGFHTTVHQADDVLREELGQPSLSFSDPQVSALVPSAKLGLLFYF